LLAGPAPQNSEIILYASVDVPRIRAGRALNAFNHVLRDRRPDAYALPDNVRTQIRS
jgi:hypothetical protein